MYHKLIPLYIPVQSRSRNKVPRAASQSPAWSPAAATPSWAGWSCSVAGALEADDMAVDAGEDSRIHLGRVAMSLLKVISELRRERRASWLLPIGNRVVVRGWEFWRRFPAL